MHQNDQMTPKERQRCLKENRPVDRMPIGIIFTSAARRMFAEDLRELKSPAAIKAETQIKIYETFGVDSVEVFYGLSTFGEIYGAVMSQPEIGAPSILRHPFSSLEEYRKISPEIFSAAHEIHARNCLDALRMIQERIGEEVPYGMGFPGAFTAASSLVGPENLLRAIHRDPENLHRLLEVVNAALIRLAADFLREEIPVGISDPVASGSLLRPEQFRTFVQPYARAFVAACQQIRPYGVSCHICGDTTKILLDILNCGYSSLSLDDKVDLAVAKAALGHAIPISGNVPPVEIMALGTPAQVAASVRECYRKAGDSPSGFTINTGCDCSPLIPPENVRAYFHAARKCAAYPYHEEQWQE